MPFPVPFNPIDILFRRAIRLREASDEDFALWTASWEPELSRADAADARWNWREEIELGRETAQRLCVAAASADRLEGLMSLSTLPSRIEPSHEVIYVEYVAAAPWNRRELRAAPELRGVGIVLLKAAVQFSFDAGFEGRLGLHSKPEVEGFYRDRLKLRDLGPEVANDGKWVYFEATPEIAKGIL